MLSESNVWQNVDSKLQEISDKLKSFSKSKARCWHNTWRPEKRQSKPQNTPKDASGRLKAMYIYYVNTLKLPTMNVHFFCSLSCFTMSYILF